MCVCMRVGKDEEVGVGRKREGVRGKQGKERKKKENHDKEKDRARGQSMGPGATKGRRGMME